MDPSPSSIPSLLAFHAREQLAAMATTLHIILCAIIGKNEESDCNMKKACNRRMDFTLHLNYTVLVFSSMLQAANIPIHLSPIFMTKNLVMGASRSSVLQPILGIEWALIHIAVVVV
ncbi:hypothetical protein ACJX0J_026087 [Zea mays]